MTNDNATFKFGPGSTIETLLKRNKDWAKKLKEEVPTLFPAIATSQHPKILYIGCADSRVPATSLLGLGPGEVFVHRNIANILPYGDLSSLSVIQYAVEVLHVEHILVCGHYQCGGVMAALGSTKLGLIDHWLKNIREIRARNFKELNSIANHTERVNRLVELNVIQQVHNVKRLANVQEAMAERGLKVHGVVYDVADGHLQLLNIPEDPDAEAFGIVATPEGLE